MIEDSKMSTIRHETTDNHTLSSGDEIRKRWSPVISIPMLKRNSFISWNYLYDYKVIRPFAFFLPPMSWIPSPTLNCGRPPLQGLVPAITWPSRERKFEFFFFLKYKFWIKRASAEITLAQSTSSTQNLSQKSNNRLFYIFQFKLTIPNV